MLPAKETTLYSISELTRSIKSIIESQFRFVHVFGEVSNLRTPYSGHTYFTLKDRDAQIRAVLFKGQQRYLAKPVREGQSIICHGRISVYEARGEYQIIVDTIDSKGKGNLQLQFEQLKTKLSQEGMFERERKKTIPRFPETVAVITSPTGAAVYDFLKIAQIRRYWGKITVIPISVQGKGSPDQIVEALTTVNNALKTDLIILVRGGGSLEDLWSFNEEKVARGISTSSIPVVTGIGHETDVTISDLCADFHSHTPTAAAEAVIPDGKLLSDTIIQHRKSIEMNVIDFIRERKIQIQQLRRIIGDLDLFLSNHSLQLDARTALLFNAFQLRLSHNSNKVKLLTDRLLGQAPRSIITLQQQHCHHLKKRMVQAMSSLLDKKQSFLGRQAALMDSVSPLSILARGYSVVSKTSTATGTASIVSDSSQVEKGDEVKIRLHKGSLTCQVSNKKSGEEQATNPVLLTL